MIITLISLAFEIILYSYALIDLQNNYSQTGLINAICGLYYFVYGFQSALYTYLLCMVVVKYNLSRLVFLVIRRKLEKTQFVIGIQKILMQYNLRKVENMIIVIGDTTKYIILTGMMKMIKACDIKFLETENQSHRQSHRHQQRVMTEKEELEYNEKEIARLDANLDKLMNLGLNVIQEKLSDHPNGGKQNCDLFMKEFGTVFFGKDKKT